jgi:hypothetical protein
MDLWGFVEQEEKQSSLGENYEPWRGQKFSEPPQMLTLVRAGWADGDTSPAALERLSIVLLGDLVTFEMGGIPYFYEVTGNAIIGDKVISVCEFVSSIKRYYGGKDDTPTHDDDEDDVE